MIVGSEHSIASLETGESRASIFETIHGCSSGLYFVKRVYIELWFFISFILNFGFLYRLYSVESGKFWVSPG